MTTTTRGFRSKAPKVAAAGSFTPRIGTFLATLENVLLFWSDKFGTDDRELNLGFVMAIDDPESLEPSERDDGLYKYVENYVRLQVDSDGNFGPGGSRAKANKLLSAFVGRPIDLNAPDYEFALWGPELERYDDIYSVPHWKDYEKGEAWLSLTEISVSGVNAVGRQAQVQFGHAEKPDGTKSEKVSIVNAMPVIQPSRKAGKKPMRSTAQPTGNGSQSLEDQTPEIGPPIPTPIKRQPDIDPMAYEGATRWVLKALQKMEVPNMNWLGFLRFFCEDATMTLDKLSVEDARTFKGLFDSDNGVQLVEMYKEWAKVSTTTAADEADGEEFPDDLPW
jgi:hypothetical protein